MQDTPCTERASNARLRKGARGAEGSFPLPGLPEAPGLIC